MTSNNDNNMMDNIIRRMRNTKLNERYCSNCKNIVAYTTCIKCHSLICDRCLVLDQLCVSCYVNENRTMISRKIRKKIYQHNNFDENKFGVIGNITENDVFELLSKQKIRCYVCDDLVLTTDWKPHCCYQFSIDRIDDNKPHDRNNVLVSCYYCNCRIHSLFQQQNKICNRGCHTIEKPDIPTKYDIDKEIIERFRLN